MNLPALPLALLLAVAASVSGCASNSDHAPRARGAIHGIETVNAFSRDFMDKANPYLSLSGNAQCDVKIVELIYESIGIDGEPAKLSAGLYVPENCAGPFPVIAEAHGTQSNKARSTTQAGPANEVVTFFAAQGYLVVATDYLGLGKSDFPYHPYLHADSEASAIVDSIRAAQHAAAQLGVPVTGRVMLFGYSQGGHAAMAAQREIERNYRDEIDLVASAPMAGPYHLSQTFMGSWFGYTAGEKNLLASELFSYAVISLNRVYGSLYSRPEQVFAEPYAARIESLFSGELSIGQIHQQNFLPPGGKLNELRNPDFTAAFLLDEQQPLRVALRKNDLLDWTPRAATLLCGSRRDSIVDFQSAHAAQAAFRKGGAEVTVVDIADEIPASASTADHHNNYAFLCYAKAREKLFDPIARTGSRLGRNASH